MAKPNRTDVPRSRERDAAKAARAVKIAEKLLQHYGEAECALTHANVFQLLVATILSAQCTDERVNKVTPALFEKFPTPKSIVDSRPGDIENIIKSTGFFNAKAKNIRGAAKVIMQQFGGEIPRNMEDLLTLPGVARKTANVVLGSGFGIRGGFVVDTHVTRLARRFNITNQDSPEKIEQDLCKLLPDADWIGLGHAMIWHGRRVCSARTPDCEHCPIADLCPSKGLAPDAWKSAKIKNAAASAKRSRLSANSTVGNRLSARGGSPRRVRDRKH
ncbi:MAG: endonuclease III [Planctomycetes bacterium]|nr:endonuclease III [Planctomycetota bacterium]